MAALTTLRCNVDRQRRLMLHVTVGLVLAAGSGCLSAARPENGKRLVIAYNDDYAPYSFVEHGVLSGILPDILDALLGAMPHLGVEHVALPWRRVQAAVKAGVADAFCTFASEERRQFTDVHQVPVVTLKPHLFFAADSPVRTTIEGLMRREDLMKLRLIDLKGNNWAEQNLKDFPQVEYVPGHDAVFRMIMAGRADVHVSLSPIVTARRITKIGLTKQQIMSRPAPFVAAEVPFHLLIRKEHPHTGDILAHLDRMLRKPATARLIDDIVRRYL